MVAKSGAKLINKSAIKFIKKKLMKKTFINNPKYSRS